MKKIILSILFFSFLISIIALTPEEVIKKMEKNEINSNCSLKGYMIVTDRWGKTRTDFIAFTDGKDNSLIKFTSIEEEGQKILRTKEKIFLYYPDANRIFTLGGSALRDSVMGSDVSYDDMTESGSILERYNADMTIVKETVGSYNCYKIILTAKNTIKVSYIKEIIWIDDVEYVQRKAHFFSPPDRKTGKEKLLKEIKILKTKKIDNKIIPIQQIIDDKLKKNSKTEFVFTEINVDVTFETNPFTKEALKWY